MMTSGVYGSNCVGRRIRESGETGSLREVARRTDLPQVGAVPAYRVDVISLTEEDVGSIFGERRKNEPRPPGPPDKDGPNPMR